MIGTVQYINQKDGAKGPYVTVALEDGTKGLIVRPNHLIEMLVEGNTYDFTIEKQGIFQIVTDLKLTEGEAPKPGESPKPGSYKSDYQKRKHPVEQAVIGMTAISKALIDAYGRIWAGDQKAFDSYLKFNEAVRNDTAKYMTWIAETIEGLDE